MMGPVGTAPFTTLYTQRTRITELPLEPASVTTLDDGAVVVDFGKIYASASDRRISTKVSRGAPSRCTSVTCSTPAATCLRLTPRNRPILLSTNRARRRPDLRALHVPRFPISRDRPTR